MTDNFEKDIDVPSKEDLIWDKVMNTKSANQELILEKIEADIASDRSSYDK